MNNKKLLGRRIKELIKQKNISQEKLAEIQQILDNNPDRMQDFYKIAKALIC